MNDDLGNGWSEQGSHVAWTGEAIEDRRDLLRLSVAWQGSGPESAALHVEAGHLREGSEVIETEVHMPVDALPVLVKVLAHTLDRRGMFWPVVRQWEKERQEYLDDIVAMAAEREDIPADEARALVEAIPELKYAGEIQHQ